MSDMLITLKQLEIVSQLEQLNFSGQVHIKDFADHQWTLYLAQGQIVFATGGIHPVRRWRRHLMALCPGLATYRLPWQVELAKLNDAAFTFGWEYALLNQWVMQQKITAQQAHQMVQAIVADVLFELVQAGYLTVETEAAEVPPIPIERVRLSAAAAIAEQLWERWQSVCLGECLPHQAPLMKQSAQLKPIELAPNFPTLCERLDGQHTLFDLAAETGQDLINLTRTILPLAHSGKIDLVSVADLPAPIYRQRLFNRSVLPPAPSETHHKGALIACVDDSAFIRNTMEQTLTAAGYRFVGISEPLRAIGTLLTSKPDLIFLDLVMPQVGGYELCEKLRKMTLFKAIPIVILTGNDGFVNRLRSDSVGASDFLAKPIDAKVLLSVIHKHLAKSSPHHS